jgi:hypothetical protein
MSGRALLLPALSGSLRLQARGWRLYAILVRFASSGLNHNRFFVFSKDLAQGVGNFPNRSIGFNRVQDVRH